MISMRPRRFLPGWDFSVTRAASMTIECCRMDLAASSISIARWKGGSRLDEIHSVFTFTVRTSTPRLAHSPARQSGRRAIPPAECMSSPLTAPMKLWCALAGRAACVERLDRDLRYTLRHWRGDGRHDSREL